MYTLIYISNHLLDARSSQVYNFIQNNKMGGVVSMLKGLMDHWVPTRDPISKFWKQDFETCAQIIDDLKRDMDFNNFTFYTKWYTNGVYSRLPYLYNHPEASNMKTQNEWGRKMIKHLHDKEITVGAMIQFLTYEQHMWEPDLTIDVWDVSGFAETDLPVSIADFTSPLFRTRIKELIKEQLSEFPGIDYLFLEFEGVKSEALQVIYDKWVRERDRVSGEVGSGSGSGSEDRQLHYAAHKAEHCRRIGQKQSLIWSDEISEMLSYYYDLNLRAVHEVLEEVGYQGDVGIVYHAYGYEAFIYPEILPDPSWWLVPWNYWVFEDYSMETEQKKAISKELMTKWKKDGHKVCYIGDVTMGRNGFDPAAKIRDIRDFYDFSVELELDGYLGMGNPVPDIGLRWEAVTDEHMLQARELYKELYGSGIASTNTSMSTNTNANMNMNTSTSNKGDEKN
ncbi:hypothetical protein [Paenibacillus eucommiae]|uniref:Glycosyl hydrolase-like 10 domain-containing protein n=1 Tax=Paenibacillus eucommiae TaxID=1355755 RepID=A0ABS4ISX7_9BACL|nr:hypothetical protein [Paenibacillus eucommiae]MBP1990677.1 hypothetical protein [Paenibacillus eucommiae]